MGKGNPRLIKWEGERTLTFNVTDAVISPTSLAMLVGAGVANMTQADQDSKIKVHTTFDLPILKGGIVKIDYDEARDNHDIYVSDVNAQVFGTILDNAGSGVVFTTCTGIAGVEPNFVDGDTDNGKVYTITADNALELTFDGADKYVGKTLRVDCYCEKSTGVTEITIDAEHFAGNYYVEASTLFREQHTNEDFPAEFIIPNAALQSNFTLSMSNSGDPSTFDFVMDALPAYTNFDKTKKVMAAIQIVGEENIHPEEFDDGSGDVKVLDPAIEAVVAGCKGWAEQNFPGDEVKFSSLGNNLRASIDRANIDFYGNVNKVQNWTAFSTKEADLTGHYVPFQLKAKDGAKLVRKTLAGDEIELVFGQTGDGSGTMNVVWAIDQKYPVINAELVDGSKRTMYSFDFSKCVFK